MDVVLGRIAPDARLAASAPEWFQAVASAQQRVDPRGSLAVPDAAYARFDDPAAAPLLAEWWIERLRRLIGAGASGFGCQEPHLVPAPIWRQVIVCGPRQLSRVPVSGLDARPYLEADRRAARLRVRCSFFLNRVVGRPRTLVRRRARTAARNRFRDRLRRSTIWSALGAQAGSTWAPPRGLPAHGDARRRHL